MASKGNVVQRTLRASPVKIKRDTDVWIEGRWIYYAPTFLTNEQPKEWGARWDGKLQAYRLPRLVRMARKVAAFDKDARMATDVRTLLKGEIEKHDAEVFWANLKDEALAHPAWDDLRDYQQQAVMAMVARALHGQQLLLSPGLGKTPVSIVAGDLYLAFKGQSQRICVVTLLDLVPNWMREITGQQIESPIQWSNDPRVEMVHGGDPTPNRSVKWTVTNYETPMEREQDTVTGSWKATGNLEESWDLDWDLVVFDESVLLKNKKSKRSTSHATLARAAARVIQCSGSNITHDNSDAWMQLHMVEPDYFTSFWTFVKEACVVHEADWSKYHIAGSRHGFSMREEYPDLMFVRNQDDVFDELPENIFVDIELPLTRRQQKAHDDIMDTWLHILEENADKRVEVTAVIAMLTRLQQVTSNLYNLQTTGQDWPDESTKADFVVQDTTLGDIEWPALVWTYHRPGGQALLDRMRKKAASKKHGGALYGKRIELVQGGMKKKADEYITAFKKGEVDVLLLSIGVGKYGHTLARARTMYIYDKTWDSDAWFQMLHRVGGARAFLAGYHHRPVIKTLRCRGTVDDFVELNLAGKLPGMADVTGADLAKILRSLGEEFVPHA